MSNRNLEKVDHWLTGPSFLSAPEQWPLRINLQNVVIIETDQELRPAFVTKLRDTKFVVLHT